MVDVVRLRSVGRRIRTPAVAGTLYPADPAALGAELGDAPLELPASKALIVPRGALRYSGSVAARAYGRLAPASESITRVVGHGAFAFAFA